MTTFKTKFVSILSQFSVFAFLFIVCAGIVSIITLHSTIYSIFAYTCVFGFYALAMLPPYTILAWFCKIAARILLCVIFSLLIIAECALLIYFKEAGTPMGREIFLRPFSEIWLTVRGSSNLMFDAGLIIGVFAMFALIPYFLQKISLFKHRIAIIASLLFLCVSTIAKFTIFKNDTTTVKSWYFLQSLRESSEDFTIDRNTQRIEVDKAILQQYINTYNPSGNPEFPLERSTEDFPDVLGTYFNKSPQTPDVVIIIVESLGRHLMGAQGEKNVFMPFLDSLAHHGLYWKNCIATGNRTFAALPAVFASAPLGIHGFQYGKMPKHHSLYSLLHTNNYKTHFFYGGSLIFDSMLDFLSIQYIDNVYNTAPFVKEYRKQELATYWGIFDHVLFENSIQQTQKNKGNPQFSAYLTLSSHDAFFNENETITKKYEKKAKQFFSKLSSHEKKHFQEFYNTNRPAPFMYVDDCLRNFVQNYCILVNKNTIFVIVGDHSATILKNELAGHTVPLIIWSPLLKTTAQFPNITSQAAISPSLVAFLHANYNLQLPQKLAWASKGLDTTQTFNPQEKLLLFNYNKHVSLMLYEQFLYNNDNKTLFTINENLDLQEVQKPQLLQELQNNFTLFRTINNYVYFNNQLSQKSDNAEQQFRIILQQKNPETIVCTTPNEPPSKQPPPIMNLLPKQTFSMTKNIIKIQCNMNVVFDKIPAEYNHTRLIVDLRGNISNFCDLDRLVLYIPENEIIIGKSYNITMEKIIDVGNNKNFTLSLQLQTPTNDEFWSPNSITTTVSNVTLTVLE
ncbi:MAG: LTA synthase family protein [Bacteroidales bacterium]|nr:LTA synthase family protein [Bacteroidales bacterium]